MPYIPQAKRDFVYDETTGAGGAGTPGELTYRLTRTIMEYLPKHEDITFRSLNEVIGALECAKLEFYRRVVVPHEQQANQKNGDVYEIPPAVREVWKTEETQS